MHILYVSDGKAGHRSQALGLYKAMQRQHADQVTFEEVLIKDLPLLSLCLAIFKKSAAIISNQPDYIFAVGSHTHLRALLFAKVFPQAKTVVFMKPDLPIACFDYAVIPQHDAVKESAKVLTTLGALNPIVNEQRHQPNRILIALGGSSKRHQWNSEKVFTAIEQITAQNQSADIILTTSRRTPPEFLNELAQHVCAQHVQIFHFDQTAAGWIFEQMQCAEAVWVTEDSVSMIYEALTAGCGVGLIEIDRTRQDRITRSLDQLLERRDVANQFRLSQLAGPICLNEADRIAAVILNQ